MKIKITGINGYLGKILSAHFKKKGYQVSGIDRNLLYEDTYRLKEEISHCDVIINLAGASILKRWTKRNMRQIYKSRIDTTRNIVKSINELPEYERPKKIISASAIGIYTAGNKHTETSIDYNTGFVGKLVKDWEESLNTLPRSTQKIVLRIGLVLGKEAKTITNLLPVFKLGLGGPISEGSQAFPFIHEKDLIKAFDWAAEGKCNRPLYNLVAPEQITNALFSKTLARYLNTSAFIPVPVILLKLIYGKASSLLLKSPIVKPNALLNEGFEFDFPTINQALSEIILLSSTDKS